MFNNFFFENRAFYEIMYQKYGTARQATDDNTILGTRFACWIRKAKNTHSEYVILTAFPLQQWLHERPSMQRFTYIVCLVIRTSSLSSILCGPCPCIARSETE